MISSATLGDKWETVASEAMSDYDEDLRQPLSHIWQRQELQNTGAHLSEPQPTHLCSSQPKEMEHFNVHWVHWPEKSI